MEFGRLRVTQVKKVLAFELTGHDDGSYMLGNDTFKPLAGASEWRFGRNGVPHTATCRECGGKVNHEYVDPGYRVKKRRRDITTTYDGYTLVSSRLCRVLTENGASSHDFVRLPADQDFFWLRPQSVLRYSAMQRSRPCAVCGNFADEVVPVPEFASTLSEQIASGVFRSSIEFGSTPLKSFKVVVGANAGTALSAASFVGVELTPVLSQV